MNKVVLITGCSSGIGRDLAQRLTEAGNAVIATARNISLLAQLDTALKLALDVPEPESIQQVVDAALQSFGRMDVLMNNAGYAQVGAIERGQEVGPEAVSVVIQRALESAKPKARYVAGFSLPGKLVLYLRDFLWDTVVRQMYRAEA